MRQDEPIALQPSPRSKSAPRAHLYPKEQRCALVLAHPPDSDKAPGDRGGAMIKKFFVVMGVVFTGLIGSCMLVAWHVGIDAAGEAPQNKAVAAVVARDLARAWDVNDLRPHFVSDALRQVNFSQAQQSINPLKPLGVLRNIEQAQQTEFRYEKKLGASSTRPLQSSWLPSSRTAAPTSRSGL